MLEELLGGSSLLGSDGRNPSELGGFLCLCLSVDFQPLNKCNCSPSTLSACLCAGRCES